MANPIEDRTSRSLSRLQSRAAVFVRLLSLAHGTSRVRREVVELLCSVLNRNIVPTVHFSTGDGPALIQICQRGHRSWHGGGQSKPGAHQPSELCFIRP